MQDASQLFLVVGGLIGLVLGIVAFVAICKLFRIANTLNWILHELRKITPKDEPAAETVSHQPGSVAAQLAERYDNVT